MDFTVVNTSDNPDTPPFDAITGTPDGHCYIGFAGNLIAVANHTTANVTQSDFLF